MTIRIATRKSALALWQAEHVAALLNALPEIGSVELVPMSTRGDEILDKSLQKIGGKGLFIKELEVARINQEVRITDRLMPLEERIIDATFHPRPPGVALDDGFMIAIDGGVSQIGTTDIVVLNKGRRDGLEVGHVLAIYQTGELVFDEVAGENVMLPDVRAGLTMVFEVFEKASYAIVLKADRPLKVMDKVMLP